MPRKHNEHGEPLTKRQTQSMRAKLGRHARTNCASYGCNACPFAVCVVEIQAERIAANTCPYFVKHVLPADPTLERDYQYALPSGHSCKPVAITESKATGKRCATCEILFQPRSNRQNYCAKCSAQRRKEKEAERKRNARLADALKRVD